MKEKVFTRQKQLMEAALEEFIAKDYDTASINIIIKAANISKGVFYYHYKNKEELYLHLLKIITETKWNYITEHTTQKKESFDSMDIFDKFLYQAKIGLEFAKQYPKYHALSIRFSKEKSNPIYQKALSYLGIQSSDMISYMIRESIEKQEFKPEFDEKFLTQLLRHLLLEFDQIFSNEDNYASNRLMDDLKNYVTFMKYGLKS